MTISVKDVHFLSSASSVHNARLFEWEGNLYRAISSEKTELFKQIFDDHIIDHLTEKGYVVDTKISPFNLDGCSMVLEHRRIPFVTYPFEWPALAIKDAALLHLEMNIELAKYGMATLDAHPWNILFDGGKPTFVDIGSIVPIAEINPQSVISEFNGYFLYPLRLMELEQYRIARSLLFDFVNPISNNEYLFLTRRHSLTQSATKLKQHVRKYLSGKVGNHFRSLSSNFSKSKFNSNYQTPGLWQKHLENLHSTITKIKLNTNQSSWSGYYEKLPPFDNPDQWTIKQQTVSKLLKKLRPQTVLDIGSNTGWYSYLAYHLGSQVAACDVDEVCLNYLYEGAKNKHLSVTSLLMNLRSPSPSYGWGGIRYPSAAQRLEADCVLALAIVHHLVFKQMADFDQISHSLSQFVKHNLIVEFISQEDQYVKKWRSSKVPWYTLDNFINSLGKYFKDVEIFSSSPETRTLLLCSK